MNTERERTLIRFVSHHIGSEIKIQGWVDVVRNQRKMQFEVIRDFTGRVQIVNERGQNPEVEAALDSLTKDSTVTVFGLVVENSGVKLGGIEIKVTGVVVHCIAAPLPIDEKTSLDVKADYRWIDLRTEQNRLIFELQTVVERAMREVWAGYGFIEIHSPKLMAKASENSGSELFKLDYFGRTATLAQSPQWYKQMAMAAGFERVFEIGPVFRANPSMTSRHDTEFTGVDVEMSWIQSHTDLMLFEEQWLIHIMSVVKQELGDEIYELFGQTVTVPSEGFPTLTLAQAAEIVAASGYKVPPETKGDLDPQAERIVADYVKRNTGHDFVFITEYPTSVRPFYHMRFPLRNHLTKSYDLLYRGLEVTTGAQREHRYDMLLAQATDKRLNLTDLNGYFEFFKYGVPPHGGFGFGLTRFLMKLLGLDNVRQVTYLYRGINRLTP